MAAEHFGARLRELREAAGLSRKDLAERAGMKSEGGIRNLEQGVNGPTWETVLALAKALGVDCTAFAEEPTEAPTAPRKPGRPRKQPEKPVEESAPAEEPETVPKERPVRKRKPKE